MTQLPNWQVLQEAAERLTRQGLTPFFRQELIAAVHELYPDRKEASLNPMIQGLTTNLVGGAPGGVGKDLLHSVGRSQFQLASVQAERPAPSKNVGVPDLPSPSSPQPGRNPGRTLVLVGCVKSKRDHPAQAQDLYTSVLFRSSRRFAEHFGDRWYILSARHGLLEPTAVLTPYDETLNEKRTPERKAWAADVLRTLTPLLRPDDLLVITAGQAYRQYLTPALLAAGYQVHEPLKHTPGLSAQASVMDRAIRRGTW